LLFEVVMTVLMPALHSFPEEAAIIGRLIPAYGEFEYIFAYCAGHVLDDADRAIKLAFRLRSEINRFDACDALIRGPAIKAGLEKQYLDTHTAMSYCRKIRNQYAHCHWAYHPTAGLFFVDLEPSAKEHSTITYDWKHVDQKLLERQEAYFIYCLQCLNFLQGALAVKPRRPMISPPFPMPKGRQKPPLHNPQDLHIPPWIIQDPSQPPEPLPQEAEERDNSHSPKPKVRNPSVAQRRKAALERRSKPTK
jgi:hypothetical protein